MEESIIATALKVMGVGITTVFAVLLIIIGLGKLLINFVNKYAPEEEKTQKVATQQASLVSGDVRQAIEKAINQISDGKAMVEKIEKL